MESESVEPLPFKPDYAVPPGATITDCLNERGQSISELAQAVGVTVDYMTDVIDARLPITEELADKLGAFFGITPKFWLNRQDSYDETLYRLFWERCRKKPNLFAHFTDDQIEALQALLQCVDEGGLPSLEEVEFCKNINLIEEEFNEEFRKRFFPKQ